MNTDIRISIGFQKHLKTKKLVKRLGEVAPLRLLALWEWTAVNRPDGNLEGLSDEDIELSFDCDIEGFVKALADVGFLDGDEGKRSLHDWAEHQPWVTGVQERSDYGRLNRLWRMNKAAAGYLREQGVKGLTKEEYQFYKKWKPPKETSSTLEAPFKETTTPLEVPLKDACANPCAPEPEPEPEPEPTPKVNNIKTNTRGEIENSLSQDIIDEIATVTARTSPEVSAAFLRWATAINEEAARVGSGKRPVTSTTIGPSFLSLNAASPTDREKLDHLTRATAGLWRDLSRDYGKTRASPKPKKAGVQDSANDVFTRDQYE